MKPDPQAEVDPASRDRAMRWLSPVADGHATMSQRKLSSIDQHAGGLDVVRSVADELQVHLLQLTDDRGNVLVAASRHAFKVIA